MPEPLPALPRGRLVFIDANIFIYGLLRVSPQCLDLMERCRREDVVGVTTTEVVGEVCHRLMINEAVDSGIIPRHSAHLLRPKYEAIRTLRKYWELTSQIFDLNLVVLSFDQGRHPTAQQIRQRYGLLTNDSLTLAACLEREIRLMATRDSDIERIPELAVYNPTDLP